MIHWKYLKYVARHKLAVFWAGWKLTHGWQRAKLLPRLLIHDWSKFMPREWIPYARNFYGKYPKYDEVHGDMRYIYTGPYREDVKRDFKIAWNYHQKINDHHWQFWVLVNDSEEPKMQALDMPEIAILEMVSDWVGAGLTITGRIEIAKWYEANRDKIILSERTRERVDFLIHYAQGLLEDYYELPPKLAEIAVAIGSALEVADANTVSSLPLVEGSGSSSHAPGETGAI